MDSLRTLLITSSVALSACAPFIPVTDLQTVPASEKQAALRLRVFTLESPSYPDIETVLGSITAYSCKARLNDSPASKGDALLSLRLEALKLGADGVIDMTFDTRGTDAWGTNCWETVQANGTAVKFRK